MVNVTHLARLNLQVAGLMLDESCRAILTGTDTINEVKTESY